MQNVAGVIVIVSAIFISGCGSKWGRLDNQPMTQAEFQNARTVCRVDEKLAQIEQAEAKRYAGLLSSRTNEATMVANEDFALEVQAINAGIDECMQQQGYIKE